MQWGKGGIPAETVLCPIPVAEIPRYTLVDRINNDLGFIIIQSEWGCGWVPPREDLLTPTTLEQLNGLRYSLDSQNKKLRKTLEFASVNYSVPENASRIRSGAEQKEKIHVF